MGRRPVCGLAKRQADVLVGWLVVIGPVGHDVVHLVSRKVTTTTFRCRSLACTRSQSDTAEQRAQQFIAASFFVLAAYVAVEAVLALAQGDHPEASWVGIGLAAFTAPTMPVLARAKRTVGMQLGSSATVSEGAQNMICAYLSIALLVGLLADATLGWWWADPIAALVIAAVAFREASRAGAARAAATAAEVNSTALDTVDHRLSSETGSKDCP